MWFTFGEEDGYSVGIVSWPMPYDYFLDHTRQRLTTVAAGPVGLAEALALIDRQAADGAWSYTVLHDARLHHLVIAATQRHDGPIPLSLPNQ